MTDHQAHELWECWFGELVVEGLVRHVVLGHGLEEANDVRDRLRRARGHRSHKRHHDLLGMDRAHPLAETCAAPDCEDRRWTHGSAQGGLDSAKVSFVHWGLLGFGFGRTFPIPRSSGGRNRRRC